MSEILGICGSARKTGSTAFLVKEVVQSTGMDGELIYLSDLTIGFCLGCRSCMQNRGVCVRDDDMGRFSEKLLSARAIVLGSPNYYFDVSGLMKNMIDRSFALSYRGIGEDTGMAWHGRKPLVTQVGGIVITQAGGGGEKAEDTFKCFFDYSGLNWVGTIIASLGNQHVKEFPEYLEEARTLGHKIRAHALKSPL